MKQTKIESLHPGQITGLIVDLFEQIQMQYDIKPPDTKFTSYFLNTIKKHFPFLSFEQIESAFERNSTGLLDNYLPRVGTRADNKVEGFNMQDLTKVIKAYMIYSNIGQAKKNTSGTFAPTNEGKNKIHNDYLDRLCKIFDTYKKTKERTPIFTLMSTAEFLARLGLLDKDNIQFGSKVKKTAEMPIKVGDFMSRAGHNEDLIYSCFDELIGQGKDLESFFKYERNKYL